MTDNRWLQIAENREHHFRQTNTPLGPEARWRINTYLCMIIVWRSLIMSYSSFLGLFKITSSTQCSSTITIASCIVNSYKFFFYLTCLIFILLPQSLQFTLCIEYHPPVIQCMDYYFWHMPIESPKTFSK